MTDKERFITLYTKSVRREGADALLRYLEADTDFFTAPASARYHLSEEGGLVKHSINVYSRLRADPESCITEETAAVCGLLHDLCKTNFYIKDFKNVKNESGKWNRVPCYVIKDSFPFGHGEKSVYIIQRFMKLLPEEALAIRWHMGAFNVANSSDVSAVFSTSRLALELHIADLKAAYIDEGDANAEV